jgi:hypothetical protein
MKCRAAFLSALLVLSGGSAAGAGPVVDAAQRAETLQAEGRIAEAYDALHEALDALWAEAPLAFRKVVLVDSVGGLGTYAARSGSTFKPDEKLRVYVEPVGFGHAASGGAAKIGFNTDLAVENTTGQVLTNVKDLFSISVDSAPDRHEFGMTLSFGVPYLRPGDYKAVFTVRDQNSPKTGSFEVPFSVAAPDEGAGTTAN